MVLRSARGAIVHFELLPVLPDSVTSPAASLELWRPRLELDLDGVP